jgi:hypothetical protein
MARYHELEDQRRSLATLPPGSAGLDREQAMELLAEMQVLDRRLQRLSDGLLRLLEEDTLIG